MIVAIDGPAGAGKSTLATLLARRRDLQLVETGALYRSVGLLAARQGVRLDDERALSQIAAQLKIRFEFVSGAGSTDGTNRALVHEVDETDALRAPAVAAAASQLSAFPSVRSALLDVQRALGRAMPSVLEGRDIGTVIFPNADAKFFVTASAEARARRRVAQLHTAGEDAAYADVLAAIEERDTRDRTRAIAPLIPAEDATIIDTTSMTLDDAYEAIVQALPR